MAKAVRLAAPVVAVAAALMLTGCGSDNGDADNGEGTAADRIAEETSEDGAEDGSDGQADEAGSTEGMWVTGEGDTANVLILAEGAATFIPGSTEDLCVGTATEAGDTLALALDCGAGGNWTAATAGLSGKTLNVTWHTGEDESYGLALSSAELGSIADFGDLADFGDFGDLADFGDLGELGDLGDLGGVDLDGPGN
ncbi:hypothetical protein PJ985_22165 [Streptomyces sp. ACA25]|uniref:hypothetical protein n=1 Tax=Streptomyces sp. ACA25 TaxID=3022596 RepID=UPI0023077CC8|nr:hypothetical protein [Streptomyces sp. ACA25]MDB1090261.1 hypothetical protein [Streptomyces sp. ACA25]